jgi:hypothetical protein
VNFRTGAGRAGRPLLWPPQVTGLPEKEDLSSEPCGLRPVERCVRRVAGRKDLPWHYLRHSVLFHKTGYNLIANDDRLPPQGDDRVRHYKRRTHHLFFV